MSFTFFFKAICCGLKKKKINDLLLDRDVENKLGNIPNPAGLGGLSRLYWPYGALTEKHLSLPKLSDLGASLLSYMVEPSV